MDTQRRKTITWVLIAAAAALSLFNVITYYSTGVFGPGWFAASIIIYAAILVTALLFALTEPTPSETAEAAAVAEANLENAATAATAGSATVLETNVVEARAGRTVDAAPELSEDELEAEVDRELSTLTETPAEIPAEIPAETPAAPKARPPATLAPATTPEANA